jgi:hypothetical protein
VALVRHSERAHRGAAWAGGALAAGFFAATYPWVDGWYDIVRADTMFLALVIGGLLAAYDWARSGAGWRGHARVAAAAAILALAFFCKQTGVFFVAAGGAVVLVRDYRRLPAFVAAAAAIGLGGSWLLDRASGGWFWTYAFEVHQTHHCHPGRFRDGFGDVLGHFPAVTAVVGATLLAVLATWAWRRRPPPSSGPLLLWSFVFAVATAVGAVGIATMWSHRNAFIPALTAGGLAAGAALPALLGLGRAWLGERPRGQAVGRGLAVAAGGALALQLILAWWSPGRFIPTAADRAAGAALIETLRGIEGEVFIPFHPWYGRLAGKRVYTHRMGVHDLRYQPPAHATEAECFFAHSAGRKNWPVRGLPDAFARQEFAAVIWDNRPIQSDPYFPGSAIARSYRLDDHVPAGARPRVVTGAKVVPEQIWVPIRRGPPPPGASVLHDFEDGRLTDWLIDGTAWGRAPVTGPLTIFHQAAVRRYRGRFFVDSMHGGDAAVGSLTSPAFTLTGQRITFLLSGGAEAEELRGRQREPGPVSRDQRPWLRVELRIAGRSIRHATLSAPTERMTEIQWRLPEHVGSTAVLVLVDNDRSSWGHLNADEFLMWKE